LRVPGFGGIEGFGKGVGTFAASIPLSVPIFPAGGGKMATLGQKLTSFRENSWKMKQGTGFNRNDATAGGGAGGAGATELEQVLKGDAATRNVLKNDIKHIVDNSGDAAQIRAKLLEIRTKLRGRGPAYAHLSNLQDGHMMEALKKGEPIDKYDGNFDTPQFKAKITN